LLLSLFEGFANPQLHIAQAASFTVSKTTDSADGTCDADCSLREAIIAANSTAEADTIILGVGTYELTLAGSDDTAYLGDLDITKPVTITGQGPVQTIIDANSIDRVFEARLNAGTVVFSDLTITGGSSATFCGGVFSTTGVNLELVRVTVRENQAITVGGGLCGGTNTSIQNSQITYNTAGTKGGGIYLGNGDLTVIETDINHNIAGSGGGGIYVELEEGLVTFTGPGSISNNQACDGGAIYLYEGSADLEDVELQSNDTTDCGHGGAVNVNQDTALFTLKNGSLTQNQAEDGGGIYIHDGSASLERVAMTGNYADNIGGGVYNGYGILSMTNVTVSGNSAQVNSSLGGGGGGLFLGGSSIWSSQTDLTFVTIADNTTGTGSNGIPGAGGIQFTSGDLDLQNTIIADNRNDIGDANCIGANESISVVTSLGNNIEDSDTCGLTETSDQTDTDPLLSDLTTAGVHPLQSNSPAIDTGVCLAGIEVDQLGSPRPQGDGCDIGAFEAAEQVPVGLLSVSINGPSTGGVGVTYTFTAEVTPADASQPITYTWAPVPDSGQGTASVTYEWTAPGAKEITVTAQNKVNSVSSLPFIITIDETILPTYRHVFLPLTAR
jgi:CSLREA domain-containing protein